MSNSSYISRSIVILLWNAIGLANHKNEFIIILNEKIIDIISETLFTSNTEFSISGYTIISANHPEKTTHASAAILIRSPIQITSLPSINEDLDNSLWKATRNCLKQKPSPTSLKNSDGT